MFQSVSRLAGGEEGHVNGKHLDFGRPILLYLFIAEHFGARLSKGMHTMLTAYILAAMKRARYEILDDRSYYGEIPGFRGVYANAETLEACRDQLQDVLEGWIVLGLRLGHELPSVSGLRLDVEAEPV